ncbi:MAG: glutaminase domain-containing protein [Phycisphaeraceae bacterium]
MSWMISRLGSRFSLLFEPYRQRVMHSALGRFLDQPLDLMVGLEEPNGTQRVLPFTTEGVCLSNPEQFERINSITFRGYSEEYSLRFEFNVHSVFYPQDERLCTMPAIYLEMRVNPVPPVRRSKPIGPTPNKVTLFIRLRRPDTHITAHGDGDNRSAARIDLSYASPLTPQIDGQRFAHADAGDERQVQVHERIVSLNDGCTALDTGDGLRCELPVTETGSGIKWRLVWGAHVGEPVMQVQRGGKLRNAGFRYVDHWIDLDAVLDEAVQTRDDRLAHSRRFEKLIEQAPIDVAERHLLNQGFQNWLSNTFWLRILDEDAPASQWFSVWEGACLHHSALEVEYNVALVYLALWPQLLAMQFSQWAEHSRAHEPSGGGYLDHDLGEGGCAAGEAHPHAMELANSSDFLLLLQAYTHWTGDTVPAKTHTDLIEQLARYLIWTDRDGSGFPSEGVAAGSDPARPASALVATKQTTFAVKRAMALNGAGTLLTMLGREELARQCEASAEQDMQKIDRVAWRGDHYAGGVESTGAGVLYGWTGQALTGEQLPEADAYAIDAAVDGLLLPTLIGQPLMLDGDRLRKDITGTLRENLSRYGCGRTSTDPENVHVSQNLWRDYMARYLGMVGGLSAQHYWDMQVMSNTHAQSLGYVDSYINDDLRFHPRGITAIGGLLAGPRLIIDRLAAGGLYITVEPDRHRRQRWPLLPLADWKAGKIPVCVVDDNGKVSIESRIDPVVIHGSTPDEAEQKSAGLIG